MSEEPVAVRCSVIVPSHNGEDTLPECLAALADLVAPRGGMELILVDNASTDASPGLLEMFARSAGGTFVSEPRRGKSYALNNAIERAHGDILLFLDDDVVAANGLAVAYCDAADAFPEASVFAGQVRPGWREPPPAWLAALTDEGRSCGCTPVSLGPSWVSPLAVKGGNMAVRREALGHERFATEGVNFGSGPLAVGGEDTQFVRRLVGDGRARYVPDALAKHLVSPEETAWNAVFARYMRIGRGNAAQGLAGPNPLPVVARALVSAGIAAAAFLVGARVMAGRWGVRLAMQAGALDYLRALRGRR